MNGYIIMNGKAGALLAIAAVLLSSVTVMP